MQDIDHNMDELLRKAADNYPLNVTGGNWDAIAPQLNTAAPATKTKARKYWISILLVLAILFTADFFLQHQTKSTRQTAHKAVSNPISQKTNELIEPANKQKLSHFQNSNTQNKVYSSRQSESIDAFIKNKNAGDEPGTIETSVISPLPRFANGMEISRFNFINVKDHFESVGINPDAADSAARTSSKVSRPRKRSRNFYLGLATGPEFNQIKNQGLEKTGFDAGLIAGYQLTKRLSVETGVFFSRKYYFTDGKYFNMDMPGMKVLSLQGSCTILEIPAKLKYGVINRSNWTLFSSAGISSYLMISEKNNYLLQVNSTQQSMEASYKERCRYFAATIDLSIGYQHTLGTHTSLRIEPYLQLPLKGIGVGTVPVKSAGVHFGVIRSIF